MPLVCKQIDFGKTEEEDITPVLKEPMSPGRRFKKIITKFDEAYAVAKQVLKEIGALDEGPTSAGTGGIRILPSEVSDGPWEISKKAAKRTLEYIFNTLHHTCYMLAIINGEKHLMKLDPQGIPEHFEADLQDTMRQSTDKRWERFEGVKPKDLRIMQCVLKLRKGDATFSDEYSKWLKAMTIPLPDGLFIMNLTDAVILRKDGRNPWEEVGTNVTLKKYLPILGGSGSEVCWDIPIPNYDDIMIAMNPSKLGNFTTEWDKKKNKGAVFRGGFTGCGTNAQTNMRIALAEAAEQEPLLDVKLVGKPSNNPRLDPVRGWDFMETTAEPTEQKMSKEEQSKYKYIIHVDGNVAAYRLLEFMKMGSLIIKVNGGYRLWFEHLLRDKLNMLIVKPSVENVVDAVKWASNSANADDVIEMTKACKKLADELLTKDAMDISFAKTLWALVGKPIRSPKVATPPVAPKAPTPPPAPKKLTAKDIAARKAAAEAAKGQKGGRRTRKYKKLGRRTRKR